MSAGRPQAAPGAGGPAWRLEPGERGYPEWLADLGESAPVALYGIGRREAVTELAHDATVTIVGSRRASGYGLRVAGMLAHDLAAAGVTVVSGMAWGIDAAAHRGALAAGGSTIAVLAGGPDVAYPRANRRLHAEIAAAGAAISEHPPGTEPVRWGFAARNRIMAALAKVVVIVEAAEASGTLHTARFAAAANRDLGAVPGQIGVRSAVGTNRLLRDGAAMITGAEDVLDLLAGVGVRAVARTGPALEAELRTALDAVAAGAATADALALAAGLPPHRAAVALARLELLGYVRAGAAGEYERTALDPPDPEPGAGRSRGDHGEAATGTH